MPTESGDQPFFVPKRVPSLGWRLNRAHPESGRFIRATFITYGLVYGAIAAALALALWLFR